MIASHNSFSYDKPVNPLHNLISIFWRCQKVNIKTQYNLGVRIFDIRVKRYKQSWHAGHGLYTSRNISFETISDICKYFKFMFPESIIRVYLEDNTDSKKFLDTTTLFLKEARFASFDYKDIIFEYGTHHPWKTYYKNNDLPFNEIKEYYCHLFNWDTDKGFWDNIKQMDWRFWCLPLYSKKHNPYITQEMINDDTMHIMDYIGVYPK